MSEGPIQGFRCRTCGRTLETETRHGRCPACDGNLEAIAEPRRSPIGFEGPITTMWDFHALLPFDREDAVTMGEGGTPLVSAPRVADSIGVDELLIKDEGQNPTGSAADREFSLALTAATNHGETHGSLAAPGAGGQSFAAYTARAGLAGHVFLPARAPFDSKAMTNVHGAELTVVRGRFGDAERELQEARASDQLGRPMGPFETPFRHLGASTIALELYAQRSRSLPDAIVVPVGSGVTLVGLSEGLRLLETLGEIDSLPRLIAVQPAGCAPVVDAASTDGPVRPAERPDTVCGELEVPDPAGGEWVLEAIEATGGTAVAVSDDDILEAGVDVARHSGLELSPDAAAAPAGVEKLAARGALDGTDTVLAVSTGTGGSDLLRSHLGTHG